MDFKKVDKAIIENAIQFHGHQCPGLAIVETDFYCVDTIQVLTGWK